jgi:hypothetical protein
LPANISEIPVTINAIAKLMRIPVRMSGALEGITVFQTILTRLPSESSAGIDAHLIDTAITCHSAFPVLSTR